jgi:hypothetical protein
MGRATVREHGVLQLSARHRVDVLHDAGCRGGCGPSQQHCYNTPTQQHRDAQRLQLLHSCVGRQVHRAVISYPLVWVLGWALQGVLGWTMSPAFPCPLPPSRSRRTRGTRRTELMWAHQHHPRELTQYTSNDGRDIYGAEWSAHTHNMFRRRGSPCTRDLRHMSMRCTRSPRNSRSHQLHPWAIQRHAAIHQHAAGNRERS